MKEFELIPGVKPPISTTRPRKNEKPNRTSLLVESSISSRPSWGRSSIRRSWLRLLFSATPVVLCPLFALSAFITLSHFDGSLLRFIEAVYDDGVLAVFGAYGPRFTGKGIFAYLCWIGLQAGLSRYLPGPINTGQRTPAGHLLSYRTNGLQAWIITHVLYIGLCWFGVLDPGFVPQNWGGLVAAMNLTGFLVSTLAYIKAYTKPTHPEDRKFSGSAAFDFYMGIELNPKIGEHFDLKLFTNGRPGLIAWTLIDISNIAYQYQVHDQVTPSIILVTILHTVYVLDFFINEAWYLRTIDIAHDHYGFYLAWGCFTWVPTMYTLQTQYLAHYPTTPSHLYLAITFFTGVAGYILFRTVNAEKDRVRRTGGKCLIWGKPAEYITATYTTSDGAQHSSILLCSGWWGWSRHANYVGDLLLSFSMCAVVGSSAVVVWFYGMFIATLLVHRVIRDEERVSGKYGMAWEEYRRRVPWRLVRGVW